MCSITEVGPGDFVEVASGKFEEIANIEKDFGGRPSTATPKRWTVVTTSGKRVGMFQALSYRKKEDLK